MKKPGLVPPIEFLNRDTHPRLEYFDKILSNWFIDFFEGIDITPTTRDIFLNSLLLEYEGICRNYENFYLETRNAAFIWKCVSELGHFSTAFKGIFHNAFPDFDNYPLLRPLPIWIMNYFVTSSIGIDGLIERMPPPISDIQEKTPNYVKPGKLMNELPCPSSNDLRPIGGLCNGVSGPSGFKVRLRFVDASSGDAGWFCA
jgi:hypothetical protein